MMKGTLALADGTVYHGLGFGANKETTGEVVFNTAMTGYEESLTDPSYCGQILTATSPLIGNYGVSGKYFESDRAQISGFIVREISGTYSHREAVKSLDAYLKEQGVPGLSGIDTRALTRKLRNEGTINGILAVSADEIDVRELSARAAQARNYSSLNLLEQVSVKFPKKLKASGIKTIAVIDTGVKTGILNNFLSRGVSLILVPYNSKPAEIRALKADGLFLANGPGNPEVAKDAIECVRALKNEMPISGICLGHQIVCLALGAKTYKLKFGHRGVNQPVKDLRENKVYLTSQNHGYSVDEKSLSGTGLKVSHVNLNDGSVEGVRHESLPIRTVQMHPEANPGPGDINDIFATFIEDLNNAKKN